MLTTLLTATLLTTAPVSTAPASTTPSQQETRPAPVVEASPEPSMRSRAPIMAGVGATLALSGTVLWIAGNFQQGLTASPRQSSGELTPAARTAQQNQLGGVALALVGACVVGVSAVMWSGMPPPERPRKVSASVMIAPNGGGLSLTGTFK
ncbi:hypothetical protein JQX13_41020 [Archangium violaceum]|uniref:hypothetical protein n=1 Tax=Archangium violaceum TaxID=83451 RepID=UPI00193C059A|nr:hypothetical protein [Archangium violaceum]QRK06423.1 hypothetical protein JQX13_41020 [Archangium violaceum]